ncbi:MAG: SLC13 family permease [Acidobacteria bacterium]|nr:SLC13 family permease [Acidobacteriota bacterium]
MTFEIGLVFGILVVAVFLFVTELVQVDLVALMVMVSLALTGLISPTDAVSGFSNPAVITVWAVFILSGGLARTGVAGILGRQVLRLAGNSEARLILVIMLTAAFLSAFMNNVGVAALLLPVVMDISRQTRRPPSKLLIPLAFSSLLGGLMTLIGTPPNILVSAAMEENGLKPFEMFDFTPVGVVVVVAGIAYMVLVGRRILPSRNPAREMAGEEVDLDQVYSLRERLFVLDLPEGSPLAGKSLAECRVGSALGLNVMGIRRGGRLDLAPDPATRFEPGDQIVVQGQQDALGEVGVPKYLSLEPIRVSPQELLSTDVEFAEVVLRRRSRFLGRTLRDIDLRHRFNVLIVALWRDGEPLRTHLATAELAPDDVLLAHGTKEGLQKLRDSAHFRVSEVANLGKYELEDRLMSLTVPSASPLVGKTLAESRLGDVFSLGVMAIIRDGDKQLIPPPNQRLQAGDTLLVKGRQEDLRTVEGLHELLVHTETAIELSDLESEQICLAETVLAPRSAAAGKTLPQLHFREKYGFNVMAVMREGATFRNLRYFQLKFGDALLLHGPREKLKLLGSEPDFLVLTEEAQEPPLSHKAPLAALLMAGVVGSVILGWAPIYIAAVAGAALMVLSGCLSMNEAYRYIEWRAVFLIAGMLPLGLAIQQTGAADLVTEVMVGWIGGFGPLAVVGGLYLLTALAAQVMPTAAVAILIAPLAIHTAADLGISPYALMMTVSLSASASFMSPVAHPANVLIMGPGGYRFVDYIKVGLPLTLICLAVTLLVLPLVWPLSP